MTAPGGRDRSTAEDEATFADVLNNMSPARSRWRAAARRDRTAPDDGSRGEEAQQVDQPLEETAEGQPAETEPVEEVAGDEPVAGIVEQEPEGEITEQEAGGEISGAAADGADDVADDVVDDVAAVRPYTWTGGRTRPVQDLGVETLISTSEYGRDVSTLSSVEHRSVAQLCTSPRSVAEIAALLSLPLGVARIVVADMADIGLIEVHRTASTSVQEPDMQLMERVLSGLRRL